MAQRRRYRRRARENPLSDNTKIAIAVGVTAVVAGLGIYLYKREPTADKQLGGGGGGGGGDGGGGGGGGADPAKAAAALLAARNKFAELGAGGPNEVYAFQMAIGAVQALGIPAEDVIGIAWAAVVAHYTGLAVPLGKAQEFATFIRDESGFGPLGEAGAAAIRENIRKGTYGSGPSLPAPDSP